MIISPSALRTIAYLAPGPVEIVPYTPNGRLANGTWVSVVVTPLEDDRFRTGIRSLLIHNTGDAHIHKSQGSEYRSVEELREEQAERDGERAWEERNSIDPEGAQ